MSYSLFTLVIAVLAFLGFCLLVLGSAFKFYLWLEGREHRSYAARMAKLQAEFKLTPEEQAAIERERESLLRNRPAGFSEYSEYKKDRYAETDQ